MIVRLLFLLMTLLALAGAQARKTRNVVLVTADGLRWQEIFGGVDQSIPTKNPLQVRGNKREQIFTFLWEELVPKGVILRALVTNGFRVSYPGYSEILTGRSQDDKVRGNDPIQNPTPTVLEFVQEKLGLPKRTVALFGSWSTFERIGEHTPGSITINAGYRPWPLEGERMHELDLLQWQMLTPWPEVRHDYVTCEMGLEYLKKQHPPLIHIALGETDDWAHDRRYDRYIDTAMYFDGCLRKLWNTVDKSNTTLIVTSDHGRGGTPNDWNSHGKDVAGADRIWIAIIGPDTPATGEASFEAEQRDVAPTILELLGIDPATYAGATGKPIGGALVFSGREAQR